MTAKYDALRDADPARRRVALLALHNDAKRNTLDPEAISALASALADAATDADLASRVLWLAASRGVDLSGTAELLERAVPSLQGGAAYRTAAALATCASGRAEHLLLHSPSLATREGAATGMARAAVLGRAPPLPPLVAALDDEADGVVEGALSALLVLAAGGTDISGAEPALRRTFACRAYTAAGHYGGSLDGDREWLGQSPARDAAAVVAAAAARRADESTLRGLLVHADDHVREGALRGYKRSGVADPELHARVMSWLG